MDTALRSFCEAGAVGERLPSVRELQHRFHVSPATVQRVVRELVMEGLAITRPGDGTFVGRTGNVERVVRDYSWQTVVLGRAPEIRAGLDYLAIEPSKAVIALDNSFPDSTLQARALLSKAAVRASKTPEAWDRCAPQGLMALRNVFAAEVGREFTAADVLITPGAQAALDSIFRVMARPGDAVVLEDPGYPGAVVAATLSGLTPTPVPTDEHGVIPDALRAVLVRSGARLVVLQPRHANPTGSILSADRRKAVLGIAREFGCFIIEDDWVRDLDLDGPSGPPLLADDSDGHVITIRTLSKSVAPGLRVAALIARGPALARLTSARLAADFFVAPILQAIAADVLSSPGWQRHLANTRTLLAGRRDALLSALNISASGLRCRTPTGGLTLWAALPPGIDDLTLAGRCLERGVRVAAGRTYWLTEPASSHIRLSYSGNDIATLTAAAQRIGSALESR